MPRQKLLKGLQMIASSSKAGAATIMGMLVFLFAPYLLTQGARQSGSDMQQGGLVLQDLQIPSNARLVGLSLHVKGKFASVSDLPNGWKVIINNALPGEGSCDSTADAYSGLTQSQFENVKWQVISATSTDEVTVWGYLTLQLGNKQQKTIPLDSSSFKFVPLYRRHRL